MVYQNIRNNHAYMKEVAGVEGNLNYLNLVSNLLMQLIQCAEFPEFYGSKNESSLKRLDVETADKVINPFLTGSNQPLDIVVGNILDSAFYYVVSTVKNDPVYELNIKLFLISCAPYTEFAGNACELIKARAQSLISEELCPEKKAELILIVCKCHYFRSPHNWRKTSFWSYATAWVNAEIKPEWSKAITQYFRYQLNPSEHKLPKGMTSF